MAVLHSLIFKIFNHSVEADSIYSVYFDKSVCFTEYIELPYNLKHFLIPVQLPGLQKSI